MRKLLLAALLAASFSAHASEWSYSKSQKDKMTGNIVEQIELASDTEVYSPQLRFGQFPKVSLYHVIANDDAKKVGGISVALTTGLLEYKDCYRTCTIIAKFDNVPYLTLEMLNFQAGSLYITDGSDSRKFVDLLKSSKKLTIRVGFKNAQYGHYDLEFTIPPMGVEGRGWDAKR